MEVIISDSVSVNEMPKECSTPYIYRVNSIVFASKGLLLQPVSSKRSHQVALG